MTTRPTPSQVRAYAEALIAWSEGKKVQCFPPYGCWRPFYGEKLARCEAAERDAERWLYVRDTYTVDQWKAIDAAIAAARHAAQRKEEGWPSRTSSES